MGEFISLQEAVVRRTALRQAGKRLVVTNGLFDLLHVGHLDYLEKARALGDALYVGVNSDASAAGLKPNRPIVPAAERARLLAALLPVSAVMTFDDSTAEHLINALQPEIYVKGGDYAGKPLPERPAVEAYGGQVVLIDYLPGHSTSNLIARIQAMR